MSSCRILQFSIFVVINVNNYDGGNQVEALPKQVLAIGDWFDGLGRKIVPYHMDSQENEDQSLDINTKIPIDTTPWAPKRKNVLKKNKILKKRKIKWRKRHNAKENLENKKKKRKIKKNKKQLSNGKYVVTSVQERIHNNSESIDGNKRSKPFDIIVHIKMNEE